MPRITRKRLRDSSPVLTTRERSSSPCPTSSKRARVLSTPIAASGQANKENIPPSDSVDIPLNSRSISLNSNHRTGLSTPDASSSQLDSVITLDKLSLQSTSHTPPSSPQTAHSRARALLRSSSGSLIVGREAEKTTILEFLHSFSDDHSKGDHCLFISGGPGSGKTALLQSILESETHDDPALKAVFVNCMGVSDLGLSTVLQRVMQELGAPPKSRTVNHFDAFMQSIEAKCVLVLDEVDQLCSNASLFSSLTDLSRAHSKFLRIIGIANTHTLTSQHADNVGSQTLHFPPYSATELMSILAARLSPLTSEMPSFIPASTLLLASRKIASISGDVRLLLSTLARSIDASANAKQSTVTPAHVLKAIQKDKSSSSSASGCVQAIRGMGLQTRLVLCIVLLAFRRISVGLPLTSPTSTPTKSKPVKNPNSTLSHISLHAYYTALLRSSPITALSRVDFSDILAMLEVNGLVLISLSQTRGGEKSKSSISLVSGLRESELLRGLFGEEGKQDEVKEVWDTESSRISKFEKANLIAAADVFGEASQN